MEGAKQGYHCEDLLKAGDYSLIELIKLKFSRTFRFSVHFTGKELTRSCLFLDFQCFHVSVCLETSVSAQRFDDGDGIEGDMP